MYLVITIYSWLLSVNAQCDRTQLLCADIAFTGSVWGYAATGILLNVATNDELQYIGCTNLICSSASFYCNQNATSMTFGTTNPDGMTALLGPGPFPTDFRSCCSTSYPRDVCSSPGDTASVMKLCQQLGYQSGSVVPCGAVACPVPTWNGSTWTSDVIESPCSQSITCTNACTGFPTSDPTKYPTSNPSQNPTANPTQQPTNQPTTVTPTNIPTTFEPTDSPTTHSPTTHSPTNSPTTPHNPDASSAQNKIISSTMTTQESNDGLQQNGMENNSNDVLIGSIIGFVVLCCIILVLIILVVRLMKLREKDQMQIARITSESVHSSNQLPTSSPFSLPHVAPTNYDENYLHNAQFAYLQQTHYNVEGPGSLPKQMEMIPNLMMNDGVTLTPMIQTPNINNIDNQCEELADEIDTQFVVNNEEGGDDAIVDDINNAQYQTAGNTPPPPPVPIQQTAGNEY